MFVLLSLFLPSQLRVSQWEKKRKLFCVWLRLVWNCKESESKKTLNLKSDSERKRLRRCKVKRRHAAMTLFEFKETFQGANFPRITKTRKTTCFCCRCHVTALMSLATKTFLFFFSSLWKCLKHCVYMSIEHGCYSISLRLMYLWDFFWISINTNVKIDFKLSFHLELVFLLAQSLILLLLTMTLLWFLIDFH